jgi:RimJ/RimL family protein N-acetyltransferase
MPKHTARNALDRLSHLPGQIGKVMSPMMDAMVDALPDAVTSPLTGPMIVRVTAEHQHKLHEHLLRLTVDDRYLRFGSAFNDTAIRHYTEHIHLDADDVFAVLDSDLQIAAMAHVAYADTHQQSGVNVAELGVSVDASHRGKHYALALMHRAIVHARAREVSRFFIHALSQNTPMLRLASKVGMTIDMQGDEASGYLLLPPADLSTLVDDALSDGRASVELEVRKTARWLKEHLGSSKDKEGL